MPLLHLLGRLVQGTQRSHGGHVVPLSLVVRIVGEDVVDFWVYRFVGDGV